MNKATDIIRRCASPRVIFWLTIAVLAIPNVALCFTERMGIMAGVTNVILPGAVIWLLMTLGRCPGKTALIMLPLMILAAFQIVLLYLFGHSIIAVDMFLNLVTTNVGEAMELLDNLMPAIVIVLVIYLPVIALAIMSIRTHATLTAGFMRRQRRCAIVAVVAGAACMAGSYAADREYSAKLDVYPVNVFYNMVLAVGRYNATENYPQTSAGFRFNAKPTHGASEREIYVLVIGETARAYSFGLYGYGRNTTPMLQHTAGLTVFSDAITQSNTTHKSVPMLMSAASADDHGRIYREKGIITAFREAGFHTTFISNQRPNHSFIDIFGKEADEWKFIKEESKRNNMYDDEMIKTVNDIINKKRKKELIVLHTYGSHFNYRERYRPDEAVFTPDNASEAKASNRQQLLNAYDNSIRNTDHFLSLLIRELNRSGAISAMIYTSDHGENIFDDSRRLFLHASPIPSYYELHVPLLVWLSPSYRQMFAAEANAVGSNSRKSVATSASVFHTMLSLAGISTPVRADSLSVASCRYKPGERHYLNDHDLPVAIKKIMRDKEDFAMFRKMHMKY